MLVRYQKILEMLIKAYEAGQNICCEMKEQALEEIIANHLDRKSDLKVYSSAELRIMPVGSKFCHSLLGRGTIVSKKGVRQTFMKFESGVTHAFASDQFPWTMPMLYIGMDSELYNNSTTEKRLIENEYLVSVKTARDVVA